MAQSSRSLGHAFLLFAVVASAIALFFGYYGAKLVYLAAIFGDEGSLGEGAHMVMGIFSYLTVVTAAVIFPFLAVAAAVIALLCWRAGLSRL